MMLIVNRRKLFALFLQEERERFWVKDEEQLKTKGETLDKESMLWIWLLPSILKNIEKIK